MNLTAVFAVAGLVTAGAAAAAPAKDAGVKLYVAPGGNDAWSGKVEKPNRRKTDGPLATLQGARDAVRALKKAGPLPAGGVTVEIAAGVYEVAAPVEFAAEDSGAEGAPVTYRARKGAEVRLVGGKQVTNFRPVTDAAVLERLDEGARGKVLQADLKALGLTEFPPITATGWAQSHPGMEFFYDDRPMRLARWPNEGFARIVDVVGGAPHKIHGIPGDKIGKFAYDGDRPKRWVGEKDARLHGWWFWDWADQIMPIESIDTEKRVITLKGPEHHFGYRKGQWYYAINLLSELDTPGEYYIDREAGILYFWPPQAQARAASKGRGRSPAPQPKALVSFAPNLLKVAGASHLVFEGMILEASRGTAVTISGGENVRVVACVIRNTGSYAVSVSGGKKHAVVGCDLYEMADGGVILEGGDRKTLTPAGHEAVNNHIHHYSRWNRILKPAINLVGCGNRAAYNLIDNAPHIGMLFSGNDHVIEFNELHSVVYEANDAGAIYAGYDWSMRGNIIRYNYFHHIVGFEGKGCVGVYLDDMFSSAHIYGNVFYKVARAAFIGGGRDTTIENNIFVECRPAVHVDARALGWASGSFDTLKTRLEAMPYKSDLWTKKYPGILTTLENEPMSPMGNVIARNVCVGRWDEIEAKARPLIKFEDNFLEGDPLFVDAAKLDFRLKPESPVWKLGFKPIPVEQIGLRKDLPRASWPVVSPVRPIPEPAAPAAAAKKGSLPTFQVRRLAGAVAVDGKLDAAEWAGLKPADAMALEQGVNGEKVALKSLAWLAWDDQALYVAVENATDPSEPLKTEKQWGGNDAVEVAVRNVAAGEKAPILVLRGYPKSQFESSGEAGAPEAAVKRAAEGVQYAARIVDGKRWTAEWRIPWAALGVDPAKQAKLGFSLSVRKTGGPDSFVMWQGTRHATWNTDNSGFIELVGK